MDRHLRKKKKRAKKKKSRVKRRVGRRDEISLPHSDESILEKMEPLTPPEVVSLDLSNVVKKPKAKGFNKDMFMKAGSKPKPKKVEELPKAGFDKGAWGNG